MKNAVCLFIFSGLISIIYSCSHTIKNIESETTGNSKSDVSVTHPYVQDFDVYENFQGVTKYQQTINVRTKMAGVIKRVFIKPADIIFTGQPLFIIQPKELSVLSKTNKDNQLFLNGYDTIYSGCEGIVNTVYFQQGDFLQEGDLLAETVTKSSLAVIAYFPFSIENMIRQNNLCIIVFPDSSQITGHIANRMYTADLNNQAQPFIVNFSSSSFVPENLNVVVKYKSKTIHQGLFVPINSLYSDEEQKKFWLMKMINDTVCIKINVIKGIKSDSSVEIRSQYFSPDDLIVSEGGYGLSDTAIVNIVHN
jgi:hypothetical protein